MQLKAGPGIMPEARGVTAAECQEKKDFGPGTERGRTAAATASQAILIRHPGYCQSWGRRILFTEASKTNCSSLLFH